jgi:hypothetical protein
MANIFLSSTSSSDDIFKNPAETRAKLGLIYGTSILNFDTTLNNLANLVDNNTSGGQLMKLIGNDGFSLISVSAAGEAALNSAETLLTTSNLTFTPTSTDTLQNKTISAANNSITNLDNANIANGAGYITADSTNTLSNKSISYSQITGTPTNTLNTDTEQDIIAEKRIDQQNSGDLVWKLNNGLGQSVKTYLKCQAHANTTTSDKEFIFPSLNIGSNSDILCGLSSTQTLTNKTISALSNSITGLGISNITNLQTEIDTKQDTLTAGTNITISGTTISAAGSSSSWTALIGGDIYKLGGDVGIGTSSPAELLHCKGQLSLYTNEISGTEIAQTSQAGTSNIIFASNNYASYISNSLQSNGLKWKALAQFGGSFNYNKTTAAIYFTPENNWFRGALTFHTNSSQTATGSSTERMRITNSGRVGIGTTQPNYPLEIDGYKTQTLAAVGYYLGVNNVWNTTNYGGSNNISLFTSHGILANTMVAVNSDRRIKKNIVDVPDNLALQMVRDIPCRYYDYVDTLKRGTETTIGFIAQEVKEVVPSAVITRNEFIPNVFKKLENINWIEDASKNTFSLETDELTDCSGVKYRFYVSDISGNDSETKKEIMGNSDNTFTFDSSYNNVFCYGIEVADFLSLDKQKIFALHHSAIQELDRLVQDLRTKDEKIVELKHEVAALQKEMYYLQEQDKIKFDDLESRLKNLENTG